MELDTAMSETHPTFAPQDVEDNTMREVSVNKAVSEGAVCEGAVSEEPEASQESTCENNVRVSEGAVREGAVGEETVCNDQKLKYKRCLVCKRECDKRIKRCKECRGGLYCSRTCREAHEEKHKDLCKYILDLEKMEERKRVADAFSVRERNQVKLKVKNRLVKLVGEKPMLDCTLNGRDTQALWDTGAMVSMVNYAWLK